MSDFNADARARLKALHPGLFPASPEEIEIKRLQTTIDARDAEIERLKGWLKHISTAGDDGDDDWYWHSKAERALEGEAVPS